MNNCKLHDGKIKLGGYKGGRGYCGYHITHFGKKVFLRSMQEFIYAKYLDLLKIYYLTENITYNINGVNYKPDFFIYDGEFERLNKIVEIKYTNREKSQYQKEYSLHFSKLGIGYEVLSKSDIKTMIRNNNISTDDIFEWKQNFVKNYSRFDYTGEKNPMYGVRHSKKTKKKIGNKTKEYFKDPDVVRKHKIAREFYWKTEGGLLLKKKYAEMRKQESSIKNPTIEMVCKECGMTYTKKLKERFHKETCSNKCQQKYNWRIGKNVYRGGANKTYKTKIKKYFGFVINVVDKCVIDNSNYDNIIEYQKSVGTIPKHFGMNLCVVEKYFGSLSNLKKELRMDYGKTSKR